MNIGTHMISRKKRLYDLKIDISEEEKSNFEDLLKNFSIPKEKSLVTGVVTRTADNKIWIDIKAKSEGMLPKEEFNIKGFGEIPTKGDKVELWLQSVYTNDQESVSVSFARGAQMRAWKMLENTYKNKKLVDGVVLSKTPGGYIVSILPYGARAFLPLSQSDPQMSRNQQLLQKYSTEMHPFMIIKMERNLNIIVSRKEVMLQNGASQTPSTTEENTEAKS